MLFEPGPFHLHFPARGRVASGRPSGNGQEKRQHNDGQPGNHARLDAGRFVLFGSHFGIDCPHGLGHAFSKLALNMERWRRKSRVGLLSKNRLKEHHL
jgi:hypothetical protein